MKVRMYRPPYLPNAYQIVYIPLSKIDYLYKNFDLVEIARKFNDTIIGFLINRFLSLFNPEDIIIIEDHDTFNVDHTLSQIAYPLLKHFRKHLSGCPCWLDPDDLPEKLGKLVQEEINSDLSDMHISPQYTSEEEKEWYKMKAWEWILDEIIWTFEQKIKDGNESQFYTKVENANETSKKFFIPHYICDQEGLKKHNERMQNGFRLFGKYFQNLWN